MRRGITIFLLSAGAVAGFTIGFARLHHGYGPGCGPGRGAWGHGFGRDRVAFEEHVADVCTRSAERVIEGRAKAGPAPAPAPAPAAP